MSRRKGRATQEDAMLYDMYDSYHKKTTHKTQPQQDNTINFSSYLKQKKSVHLTAKTENQQEYVYQLTDPSLSIVLATGPAGAGKTYMAMLAAIKALREGHVDKIIISRPSTGVDDEKMGFLPGTLMEKMAPWCIPLLDVLKQYYSVPEINKMIENEIIEMTPIAFMRGRTFTNCFVIIDEAQNTSVNQILAITTRVGENCKMVITGDLKQHDKKFMVDNGFKDFLQRVKSTDTRFISYIDFNQADIQRSETVKEVLRLYGEE
jgi:phosphate starvation-inducible protein PhoH and related proteins